MGRRQVQSPMGEVPTVNTGYKIGVPLFLFLNCLRNFSKFELVFQFHIFLFFA
jgi:hypothetical protein